MVYENDSTQNISNGVLSKQDIFRQIDNDILSQKQQHTAINQRTKSNYRFVVILDLLALFLAIVGILFVHNIFREQQIRLVSGHQGVKALESTLLEEINKQYAQNLAEMEERLKDSNRRIAEMELLHNQELSRIAEESVLELERQKVIIQRQLAEELAGKSLSEQDEIRRQYETQLQQLEDSINRERIAKENSEKESHKLMIAQISEDLEHDRKESATLKKNIGEIQEQVSQRDLEIERLQGSSEVVRNFDDSATSLFLEAKKFIDNKDYDKATEPLNKISNLYKNSPSAFSPQRKESDIYFVNVLRNFMDTSSRYEEQQNIVSNLEQILSSDVRVSAEDINIINKEAEKNREKLIKDITDMMDRGDDFIQNRQYKEAVDAYQAALRFSMEDQAQEVIQKLYNAILLEINDSGVTIPRNLESSVRKLLKDTRYNDNIYDSIIYLKEPDGYISDIVDKNNVIVLLLPRVRANRNQTLEVFRVTSSNGVQLQKITEFTTKKFEKDSFNMTITNHKVRLGDLIYIK